MADTREQEITDEMRALAEEHNLGPEDLLKLPDYLKLRRNSGSSCGSCCSTRTPAPSGFLNKLKGDDAKVVYGHTAHEHEHFSFGLRQVSTRLTEGVTYEVHAWMHPDLGGEDVNGRFTV